MFAEAAAAAAASATRGRRLIGLEIFASKARSSRECERARRIVFGVLAGPLLAPFLFPGETWALAVTSRATWMASCRDRRMVANMRRTAPGNAWSYGPKLYRGICGMDSLFKTIGRAPDKPLLPPDPLATSLAGRTSCLLRVHLARLRHRRRRAAREKPQHRPKAQRPAPTRQTHNLSAKASRRTARVRG